MSSIFSKIISGAVPSHRVYEDEHCFAFLDINPRHEGHTLVVPKREIDYLFDLPDEDYAALWEATARVATALKAATTCKRVAVLVLGYEIPHAHIHLIPSNQLGDLPLPPIDEEAAARLDQTAEVVRAALG